MAGRNRDADSLVSIIRSFRQGSLLGFTGFSLTMLAMPQPVSWKHCLRNFLVIDLKTGSGEPSLRSMEPRLQQDEKSLFFKRDDNLSAAGWSDRRASFVAEFGRIIRTGVGGLLFDNDDKPYHKEKLSSNGDEKTVLNAFLVIVNRYPPHFMPLDLLVLNVPTRLLEWTGDRTSGVYYRERDWPRIDQYARDSIVMLVQIYLYLVGAPLVADEHIVLSD